MRNIKGSELIAAIKTINPQVAKKLIDAMEHQRSWSHARVRRLSHARRQNEWVIAQPLLFDKDGKLLDGQHRVRMVINTNLPTEFLTISGYDKNVVFARLDDVWTRRLVAWLEIEREPLPAVMATVIKMAARMDAKLLPTGGGGHFQQTGIEGLDYLEDHPDIRRTIMEAPGMVNRHVSRAMLCFCHYKFSQLDRVLADSFFVDLIAGNKEAEDDPIYLLRERMKTNHENKKTKLNRTEILALIIITWNAVRAGKKLKALKWARTGPTAQQFPKIK